MDFKNFVDTHAHTVRSFDGIYTADEMVEASIEKGLQTMAITDHVEMDWFYGHDREYNKTCYNSYADVVNAKEKYKDKIEILVGIELGEPCYNLELTEKILVKHNYDMVIGSLHNLRDWDDFSQLDYVNDGIDIYKMLHTYYEDQKEMVQWGGFDTLAHIIYPMRYMWTKHQMRVDKTKIKKDVDELLALLAEKDIALEINTSGLRQALKTTLPDVDYIKRFKELGGKHVTCGSDSHTTYEMGAGIHEGWKIAKECGFDSVLIFRQRKPFEIPIE
ncbi:MAG: histidinol-phosphatase HisJ family protein [Clostridia bacterium]|nr:histidinol-phosphatase HisJ family protein [Clostridia bacterium]